MIRGELAADADRFLQNQARRLDWNRFPMRANESNFYVADFGIRWLADGKFNLSVGCLDRHLNERGDANAIVFEGDEPGKSRVAQDGTMRSAFESAQITDEGPQSDR